MRRPRKLSIALAGLAVFAASAAQAGLQSVCSTCAGQPETPKARASAKPKAKKTVHLCAACAAKLKNSGAMPATIAATAPCVTCGGMPGATMALSASAPGYAVIGDGSPAPLMAASGVGGNAPGYAIVGGTMASSEPAPIGVMRTNYNSASGTVGASMAPPQDGGVPGMNGIPFAQPSEVPPSLYAPQSRRRHSVIARMIGIPDFGRARAEAEARKRAAHAQTAYGPANSVPTDLPASVVYGGR